MGYTHYWDRSTKLKQSKFEEFIEKVKKIVDGIKKEGAIGGVYYEDKEVILSGLEGKDDPCINEHRVVFNGDVENGLGHETFVIENSSGELIDKFNFCKTARKPYDIAVTASLIAFKQTFPYAVEISSDGEPSEWGDGLTLYNKVVAKNDTVDSNVLNKWLNAK